MNLAFGTILLAYLLMFCVFIVVDVFEHCRLETEAAEHDELLDSLWDDGDPGRNPEAVLSIASAE